MKKKSVRSSENRSGNDLWFCYCCFLLICVELWCRIPRKKRINKRLVVSNMAELEATAVTSDMESGNMVFEPILEEGVFRFDCSPDHRNAALPSVSFVNSKDRDTPMMGTQQVPSYTPTFECVHGQQIVQLELPIGTSFYGTGEVSGQLERTGKRVFTWNTDAWGYGPGTTSLYQSHPWVLAVLPSGEALGVLGDTTRRCEIDLRKESTIKFIAPSPYPVITFGPYASPTDVLISLSHAVGTVFMPPKWSLGYHQCRWSYHSDARVREIAQTFRKKGIPCDVIWMDIDYMDGFRCFTFDQACYSLDNSERFPNPKSLVEDLHLTGFKAIWMLDPGIKLEQGYFVYDSGTERDVWIQTLDGKPFVGGVWPGPCVFPDFTQSNARSWWASLVKGFVSNGVDGIWNDMNEPAVFKVVTKTMPESNVHRGDIELGGCQNHSYYHNVYGMLMARSTYEGMKSADENKRPFVLTRAGFIGSQRYAATWTGDNLSTWEHLHMSISMVLQLGLSGQPLAGPDIGGFAGNATPKLFGRWMALGAMFPFSRGHSETDTIDHEPWSFGEECEEVCRLALKRRYRLLPHIYTLFYMAHTMGTPVATPTFFADPKDPRLAQISTARTHPSSPATPGLLCGVFFVVFSGEHSERSLSKMRDPNNALACVKTNANSTYRSPGSPASQSEMFNDTSLGENLLLVMQSAYNALVELNLDKNITVTTALLLAMLETTMSDEGIDQLQHVLPKGIWLSFDFGDSHPDIPALYLQGGSIIPVGPAIQHVGEAKPTDDLSLLVALDEHGKAKGVLFEDDGDGYEFTRGGYLLTTYVAELESSVVTVKIVETEGSFRRPKRRLHIQLLLGGCAKLDAWGVDGEIIQVKMPSEDEVSKLVTMSEKQYKIGMETVRRIPDVEKVSGHMGIELSRTPIELKSSVWALKVVPWIGGRIISMEHLPSALVDLLLIILGDTVPGTQWLHSRVEVNGYEEFSGTEYRSAGWSEPYNVIEKNLEQAGERESLMLEGDIGGGLVIERQISFPEDNSNIFRIDSRILARTVGAGSGGFSRLVCLRVHPMFTLLHPTESYVSFTSIDGSKHEVWPESNEMFFEGDLRPNGNSLSLSLSLSLCLCLIREGEWMLFDKCTGLGLVNRFNVSEVHKCLVHWGTGTVNLELWSEDRPVSKESPLRISHEYEVTSIA
ncbi:hypothetical protein RHSIM_Rhsim11G0034700 [Rhododendron simsii]|uniref:Uncharacterized protein n=1 Tax=Rhododendron simsii TaxID=118357 RepID=A0A834G5B1_RHOSS|nr:hypothetical protein RHSIM_Rhsim11G0034700 [Rhododendron simsii]